MSDDIAVVACGSLRPLIESFVPDRPTAYVAHELHESPLDPGDDGAVTEAVQSAVDRCAAAEPRYVALAYARSSRGLADVTATTVPLAAWRAPDCVDALCPRRVGPLGEAKQPGSYYLTPGGIAAGLDPYKLYLAYVGELDGLVESQQASGLSPDWHQGDRLTSLVADGPEPSPELVRSQFAMQFADYDRVVLLDTGQTDAAHRQHAIRLARFLGSLRADDDPLPVEVRQADLGRLRALLTGDALDRDDIDVIQPGERVGEPLDSSRPHRPTIPRPINSHD